MRIGGALIVVYGCILLFMSGCQGSFIYFPSKGTEEAHLEQARRMGLIPWMNKEGAIIGWKRPLQSTEVNTSAIVVFHGNAGYALHREPYVRAFEKQQGGPWVVHILEYPGYGAREGNPTEASLIAAGEEAVDTLKAEGFESICVIGESLGGGVACQIAAANPGIVDGVLLITPFTDLADVASRHYPFLPVRLLLRDRYQNSRALQRYQGPLAVVLAEKDEVVPSDLGQRLFDAYAGPKRIWIQSNRTHNTIDLSPNAPWWSEVIQFFSDSQKTI